MISITGIDDLDHIIYDYKNNIEIWEFLYTFLLKRLTPCPPVLLLKRGVIQFDTVPEDDFNLSKLCEDLLNNYNDNEFYKRDMIFFRKRDIDVSKLDLIRIAVKGRTVRRWFNYNILKTTKLSLLDYALLWISDDNRLDKYWIRK